MFYIICRQIPGCRCHAHGCQRTEGPVSRSVIINYISSLICRMCISESRTVERKERRQICRPHAQPFNGSKLRGHFRTNLQYMAFTGSGSSDNRQHFFRLYAFKFFTLILCTCNFIQRLYANLFLRGYKHLIISILRCNCLFQIRIKNQLASPDTVCIRFPHSPAIRLPDVNGICIFAVTHQNICLFCSRNQFL